MAKHVGIVGCSSEGAALCYRTFCSEAAATLGSHAHPEVSLHTHSLENYVACLSRGDMEGVGQLMLSSAEKLVSIGAEILICPDNTIHQALPFVRARLQTPWLPIAEVVAAEARACGYKCIGITGTRWLVASEVYAEALSRWGLDFLRPEPADLDALHRIIMEELVAGIQRPESLAVLQAVIGRLQDRGCDAVVLGCTELPLVLSNSNSPLPTLDSTRLLARAALRQALQ